MQATQLNILEAIAAKQAGMQQAEDSANQRHTDWTNRAFKLLKEYARQAHGPFMCEDIRDYATANGLPTPPSSRAWGPVMLRATKAGIIKSTGIGQVKNPKAHRANASIYLPLNKAA